MQQPGPDPDGTTRPACAGEKLPRGEDRRAIAEAGTAGASIGQDATKPIGGELNAAIARAVVRIHRDRVGRGPTKAHAFFHVNIVVVILEDLLVTEERTLLAGGRDSSVIRLRQEILETMRLDLIAAVERVTDRRVTALMAGTNVEPDMAAQIFVLDRPIDTQPAEDNSDSQAGKGPSQTT
jgi:uncharacterized protein YbcI